MKRKTAANVIRDRHTVQSFSAVGGDKRSRIGDITCVLERREARI
jgi:hypothetical protein